MYIYKNIQFLCLRAQLHILYCICPLNGQMVQSWWIPKAGFRNPSSSRCDKLSMLVTLALPMDATACCWAATAAAAATAAVVAAEVVILWVSRRWESSDSRFLNFLWQSGHWMLKFSVCTVRMWRFSEDLWIDLAHTGQFRFGPAK